MALLLLNFGEDRIEYAYLCPKAWIQISLFNDETTLGSLGSPLLEDRSTCLTMLECRGLLQFLFVFQLDSPTLQGYQTPHSSQRVWNPVTSLTVALR